MNFEISNYAFIIFLLEMLFTTYVVKAMKDKSAKLFGTI